MGVYLVKHMHSIVEAPSTHARKATWEGRWGQSTVALDGARAYTYFSEEEKNVCAMPKLRKGPTVTS